MQVDKSGFEERQAHPAAGMDPAGLVLKSMESCSLSLAVLSEFTAESVVVGLRLPCRWPEQSAVRSDWEWGQKE